MTRRSSPPRPRPLRASSDRWLFGYADVVTLLFACFASLYAAEAMTPPGRAADVYLPAEAEPGVAPTPTPLELELRAIAADPTTGAVLDVAAQDRGLILSLAETGSFPQGSADLTPAARNVVRTIADALRHVSNDVRVEGHTDDDPVASGRYQSNWELSTARATRVVQFLTEDAGIDPRRLSAAGYGEYRPRVRNDSPAARARNRRVDIVVLGTAVAVEAGRQP